MGEGKEKWGEDSYPLEDRAKGGGEREREREGVGNKGRDKRRGRDGRHLLEIKQREGKIFEEGRVGGNRRGRDYSGPNSMSFAHPRFVDPLDADVVGERWLLPEY